MLNVAGWRVATPAQLREDVSVVVGDALDDFQAALRGVDRADVLDTLNDELPGLILLYGESAAVVASEWYGEARVAAEVAGTFVPSPSELREPGVNGLLGWAAQTAKSFQSMLTLIQGGVHKRVANPARATIIDNAARDPRAVGTQRYARSSGGCPFCRMLASRGNVYRSETSATFAAHDNCTCVAVPAFGGAPLPVRPYTPSDRNITDADRARVRAWIKAHP